jgi:hypothetical protein
MKKYLLITLLIFTPSLLLAEELLQDPLINFKVSKNEIEQSLELLKKMGKISEEDYQKALKDLKGMDQNKIDSLTENAKDLVRKDPDKALELYQAKKLDPAKVKELQNSKALSD